jgi:LysR family transcriptional regulator, nitrogen assimilation regulatory protein
VDLRQLRYFIAIVQCGSISRAATQLGVAQPALSLHVRNMEAEFGTPLLFRTPSGVQPTEAGLTLFRNARAILEHVEAAQHEVRGRAAEPIGEVRLGMPSSICQILGVPLILAVRERAPRVTLCVAEAMSGYVLDWLRQGRMDLALTFRPVDDRGLRSAPLLEQELLLFGPAAPPAALPLPPDGPLSLAHCAGLPLILPSSGQGLRGLIDETAAAAGIALVPGIELDAYPGIKALVERGLGFSLLPAYAAEAEVTEGRLRTWRLDPPLLSTVHLARPADRPLPRAAEAVERICRETVRGLVAAGAWTTGRLLEP